MAQSAVQLGQKKLQHFVHSHSFSNHSLDRFPGLASGFDCQTNQYSIDCSCGLAGEPYPPILATFGFLHDAHSIISRRPSRVCRDCKRGYPRRVPDRFPAAHWGRAVLFDWRRNGSSGRTGRPLRAMQNNGTHTKCRLLVQISIHVSAQDDNRRALHLPQQHGVPVDCPQPGDCYAHSVRSTEHRV